MSFRIILKATISSSMPVAPATGSTVAFKFEGSNYQIPANMVPLTVWADGSGVSPSTSNNKFNISFSSSATSDSSPAGNIMQGITTAQINQHAFTDVMRHTVDDSRDNFTPAQGGKYITLTNVTSGVSPGNITRGTVTLALELVKA